MVLRSCGAFVVTEWTPLHQAREKSHGWLITYRLVEMFTAANSLHTRESKHLEVLNTISKKLSHTHSPDELSGHGAVVQVQSDDVVSLELVEGEPTAGCLLELRIELLDQRAQVGWQPQHLRNERDTQTRTE